MLNRLFQAGSHRKTQDVANFLSDLRYPNEGNQMTLVITAFVMVVILGIATILRLETEDEKDQFARRVKRGNSGFID